MKKILHFVFCSYLITLPLMLFSFLKPFKAFFSTNSAITNGFFLLLIGLLVIIIRSRGVIRLRSAFLRTSILSFIVLVVISLFTSMILFQSFGVLYGETTITASFAENIYYLLIAVTFYYNAILFETVTKETICKIFDALCIFNVLLGIVQLLLVNSYTVVSEIYDLLDVFDLFVDSTNLFSMGRICLTASEPAGMAITICVLLLPYSMSRYLYAEKRQKYLLFIIAFTILCFFSLSSSTYVALVVSYLVFAILLYRKNRNPFFITFVLLLVFVIGYIFVTGILDDSYIGRQINYYLFEKTTSTENYSTGYRYSTVINDFICFVNYPISGVGNGNQGFLYESSITSEYVSETIQNNYLVIRALNGNLGLLSGGPFVPSFISGYGMAGILILINQFLTANRAIRKHPDRVGFFREMYTIGTITFLTVSFVSGGIEGNYLVLFVLSIPLMAEHFPEQEEDRLR